MPIRGGPRGAALLYTPRGSLPTTTVPRGSTCDYRLSAWPRRSRKGLRDSSSAAAAHRGSGLGKPLRKPDRAPNAMRCSEAFDARLLPGVQTPNVAHVLPLELQVGSPRWRQPQLATSSARSTG